MALEGGEGSESRPDRFLPPGKTRYPLYRKLGGPRDRSGVAENLAPTRTRSLDRQASSQSLYSSIRNTTNKTRWPLLQWQNNNYYIFWVCICSLRYPACKAHALYYIVVCGLSGYIIFFPHYFINGKIFWKKLLKINMCFDFFLQRLSKHFSF